MKSLISTIVLILALAQGSGSPMAGEAEKMERIVLVPLGADVNRAELEFLRESLGRIFGVSVEFSDPMPLPARAYDKDRNQYFSNIILDFINSRQKHPRGGRILAVTNQDLTVPSLNFVFGQADLRSGVCIISLARLRPEFWHEQPDTDLLQKRTLTEAVHELGHTLGFNHCLNPHCVMYFSSTLQDTDNKGYSFCEKCQAKLSSGASGRIRR
jgi:archaemetzincin